MKQREDIIGNGSLSLSCFSAFFITILSGSSQTNRFMRLKGIEKYVKPPQSRILQARFHSGQTAIGNEAPCARRICRMLCTGTRRHRQNLLSAGYPTYALQKARSGANAV